MRVFGIHQIIFFAFFLFLTVGSCVAWAQDNGGGGLLAVPDRGSDTLAIPESSFPSNSEQPQPDALTAPEDGAGGAQLNIKPMRLEESANPLTEEDAPKEEVQKLESKKPKFDDLRIDEDKSKRDDMWWMNEVLAKLPGEIQRDLFQRSSKAQLYCEEDYMLNNFYDCECYGIAALKDLVLKGEESEAISYNKADPRFVPCVDPGKIAGFALKRCYDSLVLAQINDQTLKETCECTARSFARDYQKNPIANMDRADRIYNGWLVDCRQSSSLTKAMKGNP